MNDRAAAASAGRSAAGGDSPHLDEAQQAQAAQHAPVGPLVIHEIVREQGREELERPLGALVWSGLAAGLSIGFSFLLQAHLQACLPEAEWARLIASFGYSLGFLIVVLGQQQLFTETTLTALIPTLTQPNWGNLRGTLRVWAVVLAANLAGTAVFGAIAAQPGIFHPDAYAAMGHLAALTTDRPFLPTAVTGASAGWLIGLMVWLLPGAGPARPLIIILLTYAVAVCQFPHVIAGSVEAVFAVAAGQAGPSDYLFRFLAPTLLGNALGGAALVALLNHAPLAGTLRRTA